MNDMVSSRKTGGLDWSVTLVSLAGARGQGRTIHPASILEPVPDEFWPWRTFKNEHMQRNKLAHEPIWYDTGGLSPDEHAIAIAEEAVVLFDGMAIGCEDALAAGKGADQHQQA